MINIDRTVRAEINCKINDNPLISIKKIKITFE